MQNSLCIFYNRRNVLFNSLYVLYGNVKQLVCMCGTADADARGERGALHALQQLICRVTRQYVYIHIYVYI